MKDNQNGRGDQGEADLIVDNFPGTVYMGQLTGPVHQVPLLSEAFRGGSGKVQSSGGCLHVSVSQRSSKSALRLGCCGLFIFRRLW